MTASKRRLTWACAVGAAAALAAATNLGWTAPARAAQKDTDEVDKLKQQVKEQRALIIHLIEMEQQRNEMLLKVLRGDPGAALPPGALGGPVATTPAPAPNKIVPVALAETARTGGGRGGVVTGKVTVDGKAPDDLYVYVRNVRSGLVRGHTIEIKQKDKRFVPETLVVQRGTKVSFPNFDAVYHNVFSPSPVHPFDLGSYRAGDPVRSETLTAAGVVDLYCNLHASMRASILVVPGPHYAKVGTDGSFRIGSVPTGRREIVAWSPSTSPATVTIEVGPDGGVANLAVKSLPRAPHNNKAGHPYASYE